MQNKKKYSTDPQQHTRIFIKLQARPCSFPEKKNEKEKKVSPTFRSIFSQHVSGNTASLRLNK